MSLLKTQTNKHVSSLNLLRGIAALSVVFFHFIPSNMEGESTIRSFFLLGHHGLHLFFMISGFVIPYSMYVKDYNITKFFTYFKKRLVRIEPPYIVSIFLILLLRFVASNIYGWDFTMNWEQFWLHFFYLNRYFGHESYAVIYWTLGIEFQFYIIAGLTVPLLIHSNKWVSMATLGVFAIACHVIILPWDWFIFQYGFLFLLGIVTFQFYVKYITKYEYALLGVIGIIGLYSGLGIESAITAILGMVAILFIKKEWKVSNFFGNISYSLYLTHTEAAGWFMLFTGSCFTNKIVHAIVAIVFAIVFAVVFHRIIENPFLKLSKKVKYS
ncbi:MAG: peptidoglycan/LPS O-acetylase OafA/YrhL [Bacteroidia bacterium]|jgi:peptidoglycan/LPS O-acetylase OafA/YrhL